MISTTSKSIADVTHPIVKYCSKLTIKITPLQKELLDKTLTSHKFGTMVGAPEVLQAAQNFIRLIKAEKVLDIGTFTGASALAAAIALPKQGKVISIDVSHQALNDIGLPVIEKEPSLRDKIDFRLGAAINILDALIADGQSGTFDYIFIDADKVNYSHYYTKSVQLLRSGGVIFIDNALWSGRVVEEGTHDESTAAINACNKLVFSDTQTDSMLVNTGDGLHIAFKL